MVKLILSDGGIRAAMARLDDPLIVDPPFTSQRLQPASLELSLGPDVLVEKVQVRRDKYGKQYRSVVWDKLTLCMQQCPDDHHIYLQPGDFWLASTSETVTIPTNMVAMVNGKSSLARKGLVIHQTAGFIDPGFHGQVTLELSNVSKRPIKLRTWMPICQLVFMRLDHPAERPYGSEGLGSHYQGQVGPTTSAA